MSDLTNDTGYASFDLTRSRFSNYKISPDAIYKVENRNNENPSCLEVYSASDQNNERKTVSRYIRGNIKKNYSTNTFDELIRINHRYLLPFFDYFYDGVETFCTISQFEGERLSVILMEQTLMKAQMDYGTVSSYFAQLVLAVQYLHGKNIFHSNINPKEIYVDNKRLKLGGFFFCERLNSKDDIGTIDRIIHYKCPEYPNIGLKYDIWCLGCVFYDMTEANLEEKIKDYLTLSETTERVRNSGVASDSDSAEPNNDSARRTSIKKQRIIKLPREYKSYKKLFQSLTEENPENRPSIEKIFECREVMFHELHVSIGHVTQLAKLESFIDTEIKNEEGDTYKVVKLLGAGVFGTVYLVKDKDNKEKCIKRIQKHLNHMILERELKILSFIRPDKDSNVQTHTNVIEYEKHFNDYQYFYIVIEYCKDGDLEVFLKKLKLNREILDEKIKLNWCRQLICGLKYLHSQNIVHRDIKPANILIINRTLKYGDFGLGIQLQSTNQLMRTNCGTLRYMAPEVESCQYNEKCDVWSVGCVMYELITLKFTFNGKDRNELSKNIRKGIYEPLPNNHPLKELIEKHMIVDCAVRSSSKLCFEEIRKIVKDE